MNMNMATDTDMTMDMDSGGSEMGTDINLGIDNVYSTVLYVRISSCAHGRIHDYW
jgi:hypothetical protein